MDRLIRMNPRLTLNEMKLNAEAENGDDAQTQSRTGPQPTSGNSSVSAAEVEIKSDQSPFCFTGLSPPKSNGSVEQLADDVPDLACLEEDQARVQAQQEEVMGRLDKLECEQDEFQQTLKTIKQSQDEMQKAQLDVQKLLQQFSATKSPNQGHEFKIK